MSNTSPKLLEAARLGIKAFRDGEPIENNPYEGTTDVTELLPFHYFRSAWVYAKIESTIVYDD